MPADAGPGQRALFTLPPSLDVADRCYDRSKRGEIADADELFVDCVVASNVDDTLAPAGRHVMTCFVQYVPYRLAEGSWDQRAGELGDKVIARIGEFAPNVPGAVVARQVLTPLDLERTYGLTEGNIFHGDIRFDQLFHMRPVPGWARYATPVDGLYLCGAGAHPGGGVTGAPGYNAAHQVLADLRRHRRRHPVTAARPDGQRRARRRGRRDRRGDRLSPEQAGRGLGHRARPGERWRGHVEPVLGAGPDALHVLRRGRSGRPQRCDVRRLDRANRAAGLRAPDRLRAHRCGRRRSTAAGQRRHAARARGECRSH